ncbi:BgTH12-03101 [Blumeria graminis f. sp. triticale]|uniref:sn-1-specific diacylglycerol lipase n=3 Tax=Blumeria graminis TaxID=34373 RepID=A0A381LIV7_BLUGR|nr:hypothetical protein BGT96224_1662 [Blumeria graminis f. sp. tritici 96224]CAD6503436.1 BgTH12-03101 [Blumeria graminis f. sp. triticale]VDB89526.1 Bgt-1662 [Blumeria graminis f. sp. tritici]
MELVHHEEYQNGLKKMDNTGSTLLPSSLASAVSFLTRSSSLYLRLGSFFGGIILNGARTTTLTGLELTRSIMEDIIIRSGQDVVERSNGLMGKVEAEQLMKKSLTTLHSSITNISFATSAGFYLSNSILNSTCRVCQLFLNGLDSLLGSTDSSRAIAGIVSLIRREFQNPATGREGEKVSVTDLVVGISGLALLQQWCRNITDFENDDAVVIWDVVVLNDKKTPNYPWDKEMDSDKSSSMMLPSNTTENEKLLSSHKKSCAAGVEDEQVLETTLHPKTKVSAKLSIRDTSSALVNLRASGDTVDSRQTFPTASRSRPSYIRRKSLDKPGAFVSRTSETENRHCYTTTNIKYKHRDQFGPPTSSGSLEISPSKEIIDQGHELELTLHSTNDEESSLNSFRNTSNLKRKPKLSWGPVCSNFSKYTPSSNPVLNISDNVSRGSYRRKIGHLQYLDINHLKPTGIHSNYDYYRVPKDYHNFIKSQANNDLGTSAGFLTHTKVQRLIRARSEKQIATATPQYLNGRSHKRSKSHNPSTHPRKDSSATSQLLIRPRSVFSNLEIISKTGLTNGIFPNHHIVRNITRYMRFASASYGSKFLRIMGITTGSTDRDVDSSHHHEHHSFSYHTQLPPSTILLSSFVDPQGGTDSSGNTNTGVPMVHFVSLDHASKAVVLTCRGTLGFEDVLTDMTCDFDEITYRGKAYIVHKGIHASAHRLLHGGGGRVMVTIAAALEKYPEYGLVMCGHSLGGGVSALLAIMISEPDSDSAAFFTANLQPLAMKKSDGMPIQLPTGRYIHVYAYGPPATMSPSLRKATRGLITTIINDHDIVPFLSLGMLHDMQTVALVFKTDDSGAKGEVTRRLWHEIIAKFWDKWYNRHGSVDEDDKWAYSTLKALRACMLSTKLVPPGEVLLVQTIPDIYRRGVTKEQMRRPTTRVVVRYVKNVERQFGELRFRKSMLLDHSPGRYEACLSSLGTGVLEGSVDDACDDSRSV